MLLLKRYSFQYEKCQNIIGISYWTSTISFYKKWQQIWVSSKLKETFGNAKKIVFWL